MIPAAGLGTRFLPATKVVPKEMLPVAGRPLIQYAVEEAVASGIVTVILVISDSKRLLAEHFRRDTMLENILCKRGKTEEAELIRSVAEFTEIRTVFQAEPLGLADAIRTAQPMVGNEPFAVILPDALIDSETPCVGQLIECYEQHPGCVVATRMVDPSEVERFGMLEVAPIQACCNKRVLRVRSLTERPQHAPAKSGYGIFGRYLLSPKSLRQLTPPNLASPANSSSPMRFRSIARRDPCTPTYSKDDITMQGVRLVFCKRTLLMLLNGRIWLPLCGTT